MFRLNFPEVESQVSDQAGSYKGIEADALLTSEEDYRRIFAELPDIKIWIEPGSGYGIGPLLFSSLNPEKSSVGIEFEKARYEASLQLKAAHRIKNADFIWGNLLTCTIPIGDTYFLYFPTGMVLDRILHELGKRTDTFQIVAIESHGDLLPRLEKESWLKVIKEIPLTTQRHWPVAKVFQNISSKKTDLHDYSFLHSYLVIEEGETQWFGESYGLEWIREDEFQLLTPPRNFKESQVKKVLKFEEVPESFHPALRFRQAGHLKFVTADKELTGHIRKIHIHPSFKVEISSGEQVEWSEIRQIFRESTLCYDSSLDYYFYPHVP